MSDVSLLGNANVSAGVSESVGVSGGLFDGGGSGLSAIVINALTPLAESVAVVAPYVPVLAFSPVAMPIPPPFPTFEPRSNRSSGTLARSVFVQFEYREVVLPLI